MAYPADSSPKSQMLINGVWTDISSRVRGAEGANITITRGRADEQQRPGVQSADFTLNNRDGYFSNALPTGANYGKIPRNTQIRFTAGDVTGDTYLWHTPDDDDTLFRMAYSPDNAAFDIVGDTEIRLDLEPHTWRPFGSMIFAARWAITANQRSWGVGLFPNGQLQFFWSTDGSNSFGATASAVVPAQSGRLSVKITIDVDNGAAGRTITFSTASSINGTYTVLGAAQVQAGVTSIFNSSAPVSTGGGYDFVPLFAGDINGFGGKFYNLQLRNGIGGALVAQPDFTVQSIDATSFADASGRTWNLQNGARITSDRVRFWGEMSSLPRRWDSTGRDIYLPARASGPSRRLQQGEAPLTSPISRNALQYSLDGLWLLDDGTQSDSLSNSVPNGKAGIALNMDFAARTDLPGSTQTVAFRNTTSKMIFKMTPGATVTGVQSFVFYFRFNALPATQTNWISFYGTGSARQMFIDVESAGLRFGFYDASHTVLSSSILITWGTGFVPTGNWMSLNLEVAQNGANVDWSARWAMVDAESFVGIGPTSFAGTVGQWSQIVISGTGDANFADCAIGPVIAADQLLDYVSDSFAGASNAYLNEPAAVRMKRITAEEGVSLEVVGNYEDTEPVGYQSTSTVTEILAEAAAVDGGLLAEGRDFNGYQYITRAYMEHRRSAALVYTGSSHLSLPYEPTDDDAGVLNDVTVTRTSGGSRRAEITDQGLTIAKVGRYATSVPGNSSTDDRLLQLASWRARIGSWEGSRIPLLSVAMHRSSLLNNTALSTAMRALNLGGTIRMTSPPSSEAPDALLLLVNGYLERLWTKTWDLDFNTTPAGPYNTGRYDYTVDNEIGTARYDTAGSTIAAVNSTSTTIVLATTTPVTTADVWTSVAGSYPFDIWCEGEQITLNAPPAGAVSPQTFTGVTRSVNGVVKSHLAGEPVRLYYQTFYSL